MEKIMKPIVLSVFLFILVSVIPQGSGASQSSPGETVKAPDGLYEFNLTGEWKEVPGTGGKIEKMFVTGDSAGRFFVLRISNPPHSEIKEDQLKAFIEGLKQRYKNLKEISSKMLEKNGVPVGRVLFTYTADTPGGPLEIHNYCEIMIHKKAYLNTCGVAPESEWAKKREQILKIFASWKLL